jgi:hypothetical protein
MLMMNQRLLEIKHPKKHQAHLAQELLQLLLQPLQ